MNLDEMYLSNEEAEALFRKLKAYNASHPGERLTAQEFAEKLLSYALLYLDTSKITLD